MSRVSAAHGDHVSLLRACTGSRSESLDYCCAWSAPTGVGRVGTIVALWGLFGTQTRQVLAGHGDTTTDMASLGPRADACCKSHSSQLVSLPFAARLAPLCAFAYLAQQFAIVQQSTRLP